MQIKVNGEARVLEPGLSVQGLAEALGVNLSRAAVERNREIVPRSALGAVMLEEGDVVEFVQFIGGG